MTKQYKYKNNIRNYIPNFLVIYKFGKQKFIEVKPKYLIDTEKNQAKFKAAREYCKKHNMIFEIWSDDKIKELQEQLNE